MDKYNKLRIEWDCRRGMLELDKIIMPFYKAHFDQLTDNKKDIFIRLLASTDLQLFFVVFLMAVNQKMLKCKRWLNISRMCRKRTFVNFLKFFIHKELFNFNSV